MSISGNMLVGLAYESSETNKMCACNMAKNKNTLHQLQVSLICVYFYLEAIFTTLNEALNIN